MASTGPRGVQDSDGSGHEMAHTQTSEPGLVEEGRRQIVPNVQEPSLDYFKREKEERDVSEHLENGSIDKQMIVLHGMNGCGKTSMGRTVMWNIKKKNGCHIWEVDGRTEFGFYEGLNQLWNTIKNDGDSFPLTGKIVEDTYSKNKFLCDLKKAFGNDRVILLVERSESDMLEKIYHATKKLGWRCLCLSVAEPPGKRFPKVHLRNFSQKTAIAFVEYSFEKNDYSEDHSEEDIRQLIDQVTALPQALVNACDYIINYECSVKDYIEFHHNDKTLSDEDSNGLYKTIYVILEKLPKEVQKLILKTAFLKPGTAIPTSILRQMVKGSVKNQVQTVDESILHLKKFSMVEVRNPNQPNRLLSYHELLPKAILMFLEKGTLERLDIESSQADILSSVVLSLSTVFIKEAETKGTYEYSRQMVDHVEKVLHHANINSLNETTIIARIHLEEAFAYFQNKRQLQTDAMTYYNSAKVSFYRLLGLAESGLQDISQVKNHASKIKDAIEKVEAKGHITEDLCLRFRKRYIMLAGCIQADLKYPPEEEMISYLMKHGYGNKEDTMVVFLRNIVDRLSKTNVSAVNRNAYNPVPYLIERLAVVLFSNGRIDSYANPGSEIDLYLSSALCTILKEEFGIEPLHKRKTLIEMAKRKKREVENNMPDDTKSLKESFNDLQNIVDQSQTECTYFGIRTSHGYRAVGGTDTYSKLDIQVTQLECINAILNQLSPNDGEYFEWKNKGQILVDKLTRDTDKYKNTISLYSKANNAIGQFKILTSTQEKELADAIEILGQVVKREDEETVRRGDLYIEALLFQMKAFKEMIVMCTCGNAQQHTNSKERIIESLGEVKDRMSAKQKETFSALS